jgi:hypothetical protein
MKNFLPRRLFGQNGKGMKTQFQAGESFWKTPFIFLFYPNPEKFQVGSLFFFALRFLLLENSAPFSLNRSRGRSCPSNLQNFKI